MRWNWQEPDWPHFHWEAGKLAEAEQSFLLGTGLAIGTTSHLTDKDREGVLIEGLSRAAWTTSKIEGEILNRESVQSSIQRHFGLKTDQKLANKKKFPHAEDGIARMMVDLYRHVLEPASEEMICEWHRMVMSGRSDLENIGRYRTSSEPMQVVSSVVGSTKVHFEAPPSKQIPDEMKRFLKWFNRTAPLGKKPLPAVTRAGLTHLYFESIHPFEDGNGRIGRALAEKSLAQGYGRASLIALGPIILAHQKSYYDALARANRRNETTDWLLWFAKIVLEAQAQTLARTEFVIQKTRMLDRLRDQLNYRQQKVLERMLREGPEGFEGGMNANKYSKLTNASPATTTRDLVDLVEKGAFIRKGELRHARYELNIKYRSQLLVPGS
jgi:Fic family protein